MNANEDGSLPTAERYGIKSKCEDLLEGPLRKKYQISSHFVDKLKVHLNCLLSFCLSSCSHSLSVHVVLLFTFAGRTRCCGERWCHWDRTTRSNRKSWTRSVLLRALIMSHLTTQTPAVVCDGKSCLDGLLCCDTEMISVVLLCSVQSYEPTLSLVQQPRTLLVSKL